MCDGCLTADSEMPARSAFAEVDAVCGGLCAAGGVTPMGDKQAWLAGAGHWQLGMLCDAACWYGITVWHCFLWGVDPPATPGAAAPTSKT